MKHNRGYAVLVMMMVVSAVTVLIVIGLDLRTDDLDREHMTLCRAAARSAAESGVARVRGRFEQGKIGDAQLEGVLSGGPRHSRVTYRASVTNSQISARGVCTPPGGARESVVNIRAELVRERGDWVFASWRDFGGS